MRSAYRLLLLLGFCWTAQSAGAQEAPVTKPAGFEHVSLLHLPGIAGELSIDRNMLRGLEEGGYAGRRLIYDWTGNDPGLGALLARQRNDREAQKIADAIVKGLKRDPQLHIILTSHSGGTGLAVWALEKLPAGVQIQSLFLLSSALSPTYDLSAALRHVRGHAYAFTSENDVIVLKTGTRAFGTIDGKKVAAAGCVGFEMPPDADKTQYAKLVQRPYENGWLHVGNDGDHIGSLAPRFAEFVLAPLVLAEVGVSAPAPDSLPTVAAPTTAPSLQPEPRSTP